MSIQHSLLQELGVAHGFGLRDEPEPPGLLRPKQVHGSVVTNAGACRGPRAPEADAVVCDEPGVTVGIVTADCVPVLLATTDGKLVAAAHAGWRGLALGVLAQSVDAVRHRSEIPLAAVIGPHIGPCCYEVDTPVLDAMQQAFGGALGAATAATRPEHAKLDLGLIARHALERAGVAARWVGQVPSACTQCDAKRFHSYRRDGPHAGRLVHHIAPREASKAPIARRKP